MLLRLSNVSKSFGGRTLFQGVDLQLAAADRVGLVGPNGAGKSTLLRIAAGEAAPDTGERILARGIRVGMLRQEIDPGGRHPVREEVRSALAELDALETEIRALEKQMAQLHAAGESLPPSVASRYDAAQGRFALLGGFERESRIERVLAGLGFDEAARGRPLHTFSGGWLMRVELAKLLLAEPDVLLLDEPTNHLDLPSIQFFEETLAAFRGGVIVISHDRTFLRRHVGRVAELEGGRFTVYEGSYDHYLAERERRREEILARKRTQDRQVAETQRFVERFRAKATKARQVQSRLRALEKVERIELPESGRRAMRLRIPEPPRAGAVPIALTGVHKAYGDKIVYRGVDLALRRGERVALAGPNGAGKSTLLRILAGVLPCDRGERILGHQVEVGFYAQHQLEALSPERTVLEEIESCARLDDVPRLRGQLGAFLFSGDDVSKKVSVLSGGEKARLALAKMLLRPVNVLVLDEPTNHLDVQACEVLEDALRQYRGTLVFISHDRAFINALATRIVEVQGGVLTEYPGNYDDYLRRVHARAEATGPALPPPPEAIAAAPATGRETRRLERERRKARDRTQRRLDRIEGEILERESALEALGWRLGDPAVYRDAEQVRSLEAERGALRLAIDALYRDWERAAAEVESLSAAEEG